MVCLLCDNNNTAGEGKCLESALTIIRNHVTFYIETIEKKDDEIQFLQTRNEKLVKAVKLLQRDKNANTQNISSQDKRPRITASELGISQTLRIDDASSDASFNDEALPPAELNVALDDSKLLETSQTPNETIGATEKVRSPRALRHTRNEWSRNWRNKELFSDENFNPLKRTSSVMMSGEQNKKSEWLRKSNSSISQLKSPQSYNFLKGEAKKKSGLSLKKKPKLKQTRLLMLTARANRKGLDSTFCDLIEASPSPFAALKQSKSSRSRMSPQSPPQSSHTKNQRNVKADDAVFDFTSAPSTNAFKKPPSKKETPNDDRGFDISTTSNAKLHSNLADRRLDEISFQIRSDSDSELENMECDLIETRPASPIMLEEKETDSESVIVVPPKTPEIVFLDDSNDAADITQIESMDLLKELMKPDNCSGFDNLRRLENDKIQKLQKQASSIQWSKPSTKEMSTGASTSKAAANQMCTNIKHERATQDVKGKKKDEVEDREEQLKDESEEFFVRPIPLKEEPIEKNAAPQKPLSILERFNVNCSDCQNYLRFLGKNLSDKEIEEHLRKCTRHKERDILRHETPDGFWNPLMLSFDEDDPRKEVLVDNRFIGKKRNS